jgi:thymidylate kinase
MRFAAARRTEPLVSNLGHAMRILITGASGSGTSTLASALASSLGYTFLDGDHYLWVKPEPPFEAKRSPEDRRSLLLADLGRSAGAVLAGSIDGWDRELEDSFDLIVFLYLATEMRLARLRSRETQRFGAVDAEFLDWAAQYDLGTREGRSLANQRAWLAARSCPILSIEGDRTIEERLRIVLKHLPPTV